VALEKREASLGSIASGLTGLSSSGRSLTCAPLDLLFLIG
jgi:hypothetical protein